MTKTNRFARWKGSFAGIVAGKGRLPALLTAAALMLGGCGSAGAAGTAAEVPASTAEASMTESPVSEAAVTPLTVGLLGTSVKPVGVLNADALGYFEEEGVDVSFEKVSSMNDAYIAVSTGDLDVYLFSSTAAATFISQGVTTLRVFGGTVGEGSEIMARPQSGITTDSPEALVGKTVACQMPETGQMVLKNYLNEQGYTVGGPDDDADVTFVYCEDSSTAIEGVVKGEYDLCITNACLGYYADRYGLELIGGVRDYVPFYPCCRQTCYQGTYDNNKEALIRFETAALRGYQYYREHEEETLDILEAYAGEDRDFLKAQLYGTASYTPAMRVSLDPDQEACVAFYEAMEAIGQIEDTDVDWDSYVVTDIYGEALNRLAEREPENALWQELLAYFEEHNS